MVFRLARIESDLHHLPVENGAIVLVLFGLGERANLDPIIEPRFRCPGRQP